MLAPEQIYVRVKRRNQTFFIPCAPDDKIRKIKTHITIALKGSEKDGGVKEDHMRLLLPAAANSASTVLEDDKDLVHYELKNDSELHVIFQISENVWETVAVETTEAVASTAATT